MHNGQAVSEADYRRALAESRGLVAAEPDRGTPDGDRLDVLTSLAEAFEAERFAADPADIANR